MLQSLLHGDRWSLQQGSEPLLTHSAASPFATAIRREKTYSANRGTVKERVTEAERIPLTDVSETEGTVSLRGGSHCLNVTVTPCEGGAELALQGETGWAYEFRLPALPGEAVFGGGEQYRQTNLRGEHVVNFVSEHIKASTVIEKALLPRALYREKPHGRIGSEDVAGVYLPPETMIELWPRVLHFAPCRVRSEGFNCLVVLERGTNAPLERVDTAAAGEDGLLWMRNKWLLCHPDSPQAAKGAFVGVTGRNLTLEI